MNNIAKGVDWISHKLSFILLIGMLVLMLIEIFMRGVFGISTLVAQEYTCYMLIFFVFISLAHVCWLCKAMSDSVNVRAARKGESD